MTERTEHLQLCVIESWRPALQSTTLNFHPRYIDFEINSRSNKNSQVSYKGCILSDINLIQMSNTENEQGPGIRTDLLAN